MARIERATSPLPRECSTTEPHGHRHGLGHEHGADVQTAVDIWNRCHPERRETREHLERETGIEPASLAWKARVLPLNYSRNGARSDGVFLFVSLWWRRLDSNQRTR